MSGVLVRRETISLETFARATGMHPELVQRLVSLGVLDAIRDAAGELSFPPAQLAAASRAQRLRAGFALNYAAIGLVMHLLDRIDALERGLSGRAGEARRSPRPAIREIRANDTGDSPWTPRS
jgi:hypothetical protein